MALTEASSPYIWTWRTTKTVVWDTSRSTTSSREAKLSDLLWNSGQRQSVKFATIGRCWITALLPWSDGNLTTVTLLGSTTERMLTSGVAIYKTDSTNSWNLEKYLTCHWDTPTMAVHSTKIGCGCTTELEGCQTMAVETSCFCHKEREPHNRLLAGEVKPLTQSTVKLKDVTTKGENCDFR